MTHLFPVSLLRIHLVFNKTTIIFYFGFSHFIVGLLCCIITYPRMQWLEAAVGCGHSCGGRQPGRLGEGPSSRAVGCGVSGPRVHPACPRRSCGGDATGQAGMRAAPHGLAESRNAVSLPYLPQEDKGFLSRLLQRRNNLSISPELLSLIAPVTPHCM